MSNLPSRNANWQPYIQKALDDLEEEQKPSYKTKEDLNLEQVADSEPWALSEAVLTTLPDANRIEIVLIDEKTNLKEVVIDIRQDYDIGLSVLGPVVCRFARPYLIAFTTKTKIYCIDPDDIEIGIAFLKNQLNDSRLEVWLVNGVNEADVLLHRYGIDLSRRDGARVKCCQAVHISLMKIMRNACEPYKRMYPELAADASKRPIKLEKFSRLIEYWLHLEEDQFWFGPYQWPHLKTRPFSLTAKNIIRKRCLFIKTLAKTLMDNYLQESRIMNYHTLTKYVNISPQMEEIIAKADASRERKGQVDARLLIQYDGLHYQSEHRLPKTRREMIEKDA